MKRSIQLMMHRSQLEILSHALATLEPNDFNPHGRYSPLVKFHVERVTRKVNDRLSKRLTNGRKFKVTFTREEATVIPMMFWSTTFDPNPNAMILQSLLMDLDRNL